MAVRVDKKRVKELADTELVTPHGTKVVVTASRAEALLARPSIRFNDGIARSYARPGEPNEEVVTVSNAKPPRVGTRANVGDE